MQPAQHSQCHAPQTSLPVRPEGDDPGQANDPVDGGRRPVENAERTTSMVSSGWPFGTGPQQPSAGPSCAISAKSSPHTAPKGDDPGRANDPVDGGQRSTRDVHKTTSRGELWPVPPAEALNRPVAPIPGPSSRTAPFFTFRAAPTDAVPSHAAPTHGASQVPVPQPTTIPAPQPMQLDNPTNEEAPASRPLPPDHPHDPKAGRSTLCTFPQTDLTQEPI